MPAEDTFLKNSEHDELLRYFILFSVAHSMGTVGVDHSMCCMRAALAPAGRGLRNASQGKHQLQIDVWLAILETFQWGYTCSSLVVDFNFGMVR